MSADSGSTRIVVGIDGSPGSRAALSWAIDEALGRHAALELVHAWRALHPAATVGDESAHPAADAVLTARIYGDELLSAAVGHVKVAAPAMEVTSHLIEGRPSAVLLEAATGADMLVVGCRGAGGFHGMQLGSVSLHAVAHAACTVVVVRSRPRAKAPVVVGIDGSRHSRRVLTVALKEAALRDSAVNVIWAIYVHPRAEGVGDFEAALAMIQANVRTAAQQLVTECSRDFPEVPMTTHFPVGYPAEVLANVSTNAQLLVVGSHGAGGFSGMKLGSISHALAHQAHCPLMVVREEAQA